MNEIWANRLVAETKTWKEVPDNRKDAVKAILQDRVANRDLSAQLYEKITGEHIDPPEDIETLRARNK